MPDRTRSGFQEELARLEQQALGALDLVVMTLDRTLEALHHRDIELAAIVIADDDRIDGRYLEVHQGILSLLALQAPVASDLRVVAALLHVIKHAERMGDQCVNIAKLLPIAGHEPPVDEEINQLNKEIFQRAVEVGTDPDVREWAMTIMLVSRALERIGDNAVDVGEQVAFVVTGLFREFEDASHPGEPLVEPQPSP